MAAKQQDLTPYEIELLNKVLTFAQQQAKVNKKAPTGEDVRLFLNCRSSSAEKIRRHLIEDNLLDLPPEASLKETNEIDKDSWSIGLNKTPIKSLDELIAHFNIDTSIWEVERFVANKWEMGYIANVTRTESAPPTEATDADHEGNEQPQNGAQQVTKTVNIDKTSGAQPLYQIKAFLRRKHFTTLEGYAKDNARLRSRVEKLQLQCSSERELAKRLAQNHAGFDDFRANLQEFMNILGDMSLPRESFAHAVPLIVPAVKNGHSEDAVMLLSDTHFGDRIRREDTSGFPEYDLPISGNRMGYVIRQAKQVLTLHRAMYPIKRLIVWIGGDIGNGVLHDAPQSNELFIPAQVHFSYHMLKFAIEDLLTLTVPDAKGNVVVEEIKLLFTVGNHMRMDEKMPTKLQAQRTLDWLIYQFVIEKFSGHPKVRLHTEMSPYIFENIRGHRHLFAHGMQVGYRNSPDAQCKSMGGFIDRVRSLFDSPEWRRKNSLQGETFARVCIGDIHVPVEFPRLISNGSLNGQNELGVNWVMEPIPAGQQLFGVSDKHIQTWKYFLECSQVQKAPEDFNSYGVFAQNYAERIGR